VEADGRNRKLKTRKKKKNQAGKVRPKDVLADTRDCLSIRPADRAVVAKRQGKKKRDSRQSTTEEKKVRKREKKRYRGFEQREKARIEGPWDRKEN